MESNIIEMKAHAPLRLTSKDPLEREGTVSISLRPDKCRAYIERTFDGKVWEQERVFNNVAQLNKFLEDRYGKPEVKKTGTIAFEIGYYFPKAKISLTIYRDFDRICYGENLLFDTLDELRSYLSEKYLIMLKIPLKAIKTFEEFHSEHTSTIKEAQKNSKEQNTQKTTLEGFI
jgi:hypothetical protein